MLVELTEGLICFPTAIAAASCTFSPTIVFRVCVRVMYGQVRTMFSEIVDDVLPPDGKGGYTSFVTSG